MALYIVGQTIDLKEASSVDNSINWDLLLNMELKAFFLFTLRIYDEENDSILFYKAIKVKKVNQTI